MRVKNKFWDIIEYTLGIIALVSLFLFIFVNMSLELHDPDIWLHLKTGEYIIQHKSIPKADIFSSTVLNKEWLNHSWLVQVIFYLVFHFGGTDNLIFLSAITVISAFLLLFFSVYHERRDLVFCVAVLLVTIFASKLRFNIRPENFSLLFFSFYIFILARHIQNKKLLYLLPLIQLFWVNCHGFFILGPLLVAIFILTDKLKKAVKLPWEWSRVELLDAITYRRILNVFWLICLASFLNPYGYKGALYPFLIMFNSISKLGIFYNHITELLPTWKLGFSYIFPYYVLATGSLLALCLNFKRINITYLLAWLIFLGMSFRVNRNIAFFNFMAFFITTDSLIKKFRELKLYWFKRLLGKVIYILRYSIIIAVIALTCKQGYSLLIKKYYIFEEDRFKSVLLGVGVRDFPSKAADYILKNDLPGNIFNLFNYGSYLIYRLSPQKKIFIDGRTELYGGDFFNDYEKILYVDKHTINDLFKKYNINTVLLSGNRADKADLIAYFFKEAGWVIVYLDGDSIIFLKNTPENKLLIEKLKWDFKKWQTKKADLEKIGTKRVFPEPYVNFAWMNNYLGLDDLAINEAKEALRILPSCADGYNILGRIYTKQKLYDQAFEVLRLTSVYDPWGTETLLGLGKLYTDTAKFKKAANVYRKLIKLRPYYAEGYYLLGQVYDKMNDLKSAINLTRKALKLTAYDINYYKALGALLCKNKDFAGAIKIYKKGIAAGLDPDIFNELLQNIREIQKKTGR